VQTKTPILGLCIAGLLGFAAQAHAGALRVAGKEIKKGSAQVASVTTTGAGAAASGVSSAASAAPHAVKTAAADLGKGAAATSGLAWHGTKKAARKAYKIIW